MLSALECGEGAVAMAIMNFSIEGLCGGTMILLNKSYVSNGKSGPPCSANRNKYINKSDGRWDRGSRRQCGIFERSRP